MEVHQIKVPFHGPIISICEMHVNYKAAMHFSKPTSQFCGYGFTQSMIVRDTSIQIRRTNFLLVQF